MRKCLEHKDTAEGRGNLPVIDTRVDDHQTGHCHS